MNKVRLFLDYLNDMKENAEKAIEFLEDMSYE